MPLDEAAIYEQHVLRHFEEPCHRGKLAKPTHRARLDNPLCGDSMELTLRINDQGLIEEAWQTAAGCIISQASASILVQHVEGKGSSWAIRFSAPEMLDLFQARLTPRRSQCCLLAWQTLQQALAQ